MMNVNKSLFDMVNVTYEEYIEWAINNHLKPKEKSTVKFFFEQIRSNQLVRDKYTKKLRKRQGQR